MRTLLLLLPLAALALSDHWDIQDELDDGHSFAAERFWRNPCKAVFSTVTALEIQLFRNTGVYMKLSMQEVVDCMNSACSTYYDNPGRVAQWLQVNGELAPAAGYPEYTGETDRPCQAGVAPNALHATRVGGTERVPVEEFETSIKQYGSILTCVDSQCMDGTKAKGEEMRCSLELLIVGYGEEDGQRYYRVLDGEDNDGKRLTRGENHCGMEDNMYALITAPRNESSPEVDPNTLCPPSLPLWCPETRTCRSADQDCLEDYFPDEEEEAEDPSSCQDESSRFCARVANKEDCKNPMIGSLCQRSCGLCPDQKKPVYCYVPEIAHGAVVGATDGKISGGEILSIVCDEGYILTGKPTKCVIQNVYGPDSRRMQWCREDAGEEWTGTGEDYQGSVSTTVDGRECSNWQETADTGPYPIVPSRNVLAKGVGNHNLCRNPDGDLAPWCLVNKLGHQRQYCFGYTKCDTMAAVCADEEREDQSFCSRSSYTAKYCPLRSERFSAKRAYFWQYCTKACCANAGC